MIILLVIRANLRIVFENTPACEGISHLLSLCPPHAAWYDGQKDKTFSSPCHSFPRRAENGKSISAERKINRLRLIFRLAQKKSEIKEKHNTFINNPLKSVSISGQTVLKALQPYRLFQSRTTALRHRQGKPSQEQKTDKRRKRERKNHQDKSQLCMKKMQRLQRGDASFQQTAVERGKGVHRLAAQTITFESRKYGRTGSRILSGTDGRGRQNHFFLHHRKVLKVELHDAKKRYRRVNLRHNTYFFC